MWPSRTAHVLAALVSASTLTACGSVSSDRSGRSQERSSFVLQSSDWLSGAMTATERTDDPGRGTPPPTSPALTPDGPWLGTIGFRSVVPNSYEYGLGICVPTSTISRFEQQFSSDPLRSVAVGVWLKFDF